MLSGGAFFNKITQRRCVTHLVHLQRIIRSMTPSSTWTFSTFIYKNSIYYLTMHSVNFRLQQWNFIVDTNPASLLITQFVTNEKINAVVITFASKKKQVVERFYSLTVKYYSSFVVIKNITFCSRDMLDQEWKCRPWSNPLKMFRIGRCTWKDTFHLYTIVLLNFWLFHVLQSYQNVFFSHWMTTYPSAHVLNLRRNTIDSNFLLQFFVWSFLSFRSSFTSLIVLIDIYVNCSSIH